MWINLWSTTKKIAVRITWSKPYLIGKDKYFIKFSNASSFNKYFDDLQHLLNCTKKYFDRIAINETRIIKQVSLLNNLNLNNYSFEFTPIEASVSITLLCITNHLSYKWRNDLNIYRNMNWNLLLLKLSTLKNQMLLWWSFKDIHLWILLTLMTITLRKYL